MSIDPAQLQIVHFPDPILRAKAKAVDPADPLVRDVAHRMIDLMHEADGVGLAAPQVGLEWRLFVTNGRDDDPIDRVFVNPELTLQRGEIESMEEGCLSLPGINVQVRRPVAARITAHDADGKPFDLDLTGFLSRVCQHEFDHLNGVLIIDRMSQIDALATRKALKELERAAASR